MRKNREVGLSFSKEFEKYANSKNLRVDSNDIDQKRNIFIEVIEKIISSIRRLLSVKFGMGFLGSLSDKREVMQDSIKKKGNNIQLK